jgi:pimeloyl-ACP methyl ester carboxylesterase
MMVGASEQFPEIMALPATDMLGHLRPVEHYSVGLVASEQRGAASMTQYLISAASFGGVEVAIHLQLCVFDASERRIIFSIPGGGGVFREDTTWWLAQHFKQNYAAIHWIGRGRSPAHPHLRCDYDPIYMAEDDVRDSYAYHNIAAIWAALNWLFHIGYQPADIIGGSWGGVFCYLLAALEPRIKRIFPTFGCGGMSFQGVEKRSMWDAAIEEMGPGRTSRWRQAFDPMIRMSEITARTYYETATNDKFFSLDMAMATWRQVRNPYFLSLAANQDHTMNPFGTQPYVVQQFEEDLLSECVAISRITPISSPRSGEVAIRWPSLSDESTSILCWSEQRGSNGNMSREWHFTRPERVGSDAAVFRFQPSHAEADILYFVTCRLPVNGIMVRATTSIYTAGVGDLSVQYPVHPVALLEAEGDPWLAPIGDK